MTRATSRGLGAALMLLSVLLAACQQQQEPLDPALGATFDVAGSVGAANADAAQLAELRKVTARFQNQDAATAAGYATQITPCWAHHSAGAMGYHFGKTDLIDAEVDLLEPELLVYEPLAGGHMKLVGMEYLVPLAAWEEAGHDLEDPADVPELLGEQFTRHSFLPVFKLHIWLWRQNPAGVYADWNPNVTCAHADSTETF
jgi:hypothetical protein